MHSPQTFGLAVASLSWLLKTVARKLLQLGFSMPRLIFLFLKTGPCFGSWLFTTPLNFICIISHKIALGTLFCRFITDLTPYSDRPHRKPVTQGLLLFPHLESLYLVLGLTHHDHTPLFLFFKIPELVLLLNIIPLLLRSIGYLALVLTLKIQSSWGIFTIL